MEPPAVTRTTQLPENIPQKQYTTLERLTGATTRFTSNPYVQGAIGAVKKRSGEIAHEMQETQAQERHEHRRGGYRREPYDDPFMMHGDPFRMGPMTGPFMDQAGPIRRQAPRRRKRRRSRERDDDNMAPFSNPFHIPRSMRHLF